MWLAQKALGTLAEAYENDIRSWPAEYILSFNSIAENVEEF